MKRKSSSRVKQPPPERWRLLPVAMAWVMTREATFCDAVEADLFLPHSESVIRRWAPLWDAFITQKMIEAGSIIATMGREVGDGNQEINHEMPKLYMGPFAALARDYQKQWDEAEEFKRQSLGRFVSDRWHNAFRSIAEVAMNCRLTLRGVMHAGESAFPLIAAGLHLPRPRAGEMAPELFAATGLWFDEDFSVWEGPKVLWGEQPNFWNDVHIEWNGLLEAFPAPKPSAAKVQSKVSDKSRCEKWLIQLIKDCNGDYAGTRKTLQNQAQSLYPNLADIAFRRALENARKATRDKYPQFLPVGRRSNNRKIGEAETDEPK